jgi:hypothetical protein
MDDIDHIYRPFGLKANDAINILRYLMGIVKGEINRANVHIGYVDEI